MIKFIFYTLLCFPLLTSCADKKKHNIPAQTAPPAVTAETEAPTEPSTATPNPSAQPSEASTIKFAVDQSPYASKIAKHIEQYSQFDKTDLSVYDCYQLSFLMSVYSQDIMNSEQVDSNNPEAVRYVSALSDTSTDEGNRIQVAYTTLISDTCPLQSKNRHSTFRENLRYHRLYLEKLKLAGQYGYVTLADPPSTFGNTVKRALSHIAYFASSSAKGNQGLTEAPESQAYRNSASQFLWNLGNGYNWIQNMLNTVDVKDAQFAGFQEKLSELRTLSEAIDKSPKTNQKDLIALAEATKNLSVIAENYYSEATGK